MPLLVALTLVAGCAARTRYQGVDLRPGLAPAAVQADARRAAAGDKQAQLVLGIRYEEGDGVTVDMRRARRLYRAAATASGGVRMLYVPPVGKTRGQMMPFDAGPRVEGMPAARTRLAALETRLAAARRRDP